MKKILLLTTTLVAAVGFIAGCSSSTNKEDVSSKQESTKENVSATLESVITTSAQAREKLDYKLLEPYVYPGSPYEEQTKLSFGVTNDEDTIVLKDNTQNNKIDVSDYKFIEQDGDLALASDKEHTVTTGTLTSDLTLDGYYVFKKHEGEWKIYDYYIAVPNYTPDNLADYDAFKEKQKAMQEEMEQSLESFGDGQF